MAREIVLDTETTGFDPKTGDRLIEVGCIEIQDLLPTGRTFHRFVNPERLIPPDAIRVHGITDEKVKDAPKFAEIADDLIDATGDAAVAGKATAKDAGRGKRTLVAILGVAAARARLAATVDEAIAALAPFGSAADTLRDAARFIAEREA